MNTLGWFIPTLVFLVLTPIMVKHLGTEGFGVIVIIQTLTGYMTILNFGFSEAIIKQIAENLQSDRDQAVRVMWAGLVLFLLAGLAGGGALLATANWLVYDLLQIPVRLQEDANRALIIGAAVFVLQMLAEFYRGSAIGCSRFDIASVSRIIRISLSAIFIYVALVSGGGLADVMLATLAGLIVGLGINAVWMQRRIPMHWMSHGYRKIFRELFHFGKYILFSRLANMFSGNINQLMLGTLSSVANVALYSVPVRAASTGAAMINKMMQVFYPGFSGMDKEREIGRIREIYFSVISIQLFVMTPLLVGVMLEGQSLLAVWIDPDFAAGSGNIIILVALAYFSSALSNLPTFTAMSLNHPGLISKYSIIRLVIVAIFVYPAISYFGIAGAAWVLFLSEIPNIGFLFESTWLAFGQNFYRELAGPLVKHALIGSCLYFPYDFIYRDSNWYHPSAAVLVIALHVILALKFSAINSTDNRRLRRLITVWR